MCISRILFKYIVLLINYIKKLNFTINSSKSISQSFKLSYTIYTDHFIYKMGKDYQSLLARRSQSKGLELIFISGDG